ncbi:MAG: hypothetical protein KDB02_09195, partial [Acidimicrobiales bacterium]|nr:hypothetical protein [Acidimicrobiales bacterium]
MNEQTEQPQVERVADRRRFLIGGAAAAGAAWVAPAVIGSVSSAAGAATQLFSSSTPGETSGITVPANREVSFTITGGGGGGGNDCGSRDGQTGAGGSGTTITGTIPAQASAYSLTAIVAGGGVRGWTTGGAGGSGRVPGGAGGNRGDSGAGSGGGGGGA